MQTGQDAQNKLEDHMDATSMTNQDVLCYAYCGQVVMLKSAFATRSSNGSLHAFNNTF